MLTDEERKRITLAVYNDKDRGHGYPVTGETLDEAVESIVRAARAQELRDAALDISENHYLILPVGAQVGGQVMPDNWLRDRANHIESSQNG